MPSARAKESTRPFLVNARIPRDSSPAHRLPSESSSRMGARKSTPARMGSGRVQDPLRYRQIARSPDIHRPPPRAGAVPRHRAQIRRQGDRVPGVSVPESQGSEAIRPNIPTGLGVAAPVVAPGWRAEDEASLLQGEKLSIDDHQDGAVLVFENARGQLVARQTLAAMVSQPAAVAEA